MSGTAKPREGLSAVAGLSPSEPVCKSSDGVSSPESDSVLPPERQESLIDLLRPSISADRLGTYLTAAGFDTERALKLYLWNAQIGEAFHLPIQAVEVALRNRVSEALARVFGASWWQNEQLGAILDPERVADLDVVRKRIRNRKLELQTGQVVAGLSFGFWVGMLAGRYNPPIWGAQLRLAFPNLPGDRNRATFAQNISRVATLRNRIWHHEPIINRDLSADFGLVMTTLDWICPAKATWIRPYCRVPFLLRDKP